MLQQLKTFIFTILIKLKQLIPVVFKLILIIFFVWKHELIITVIIELIKCK